MPKESDGSSLLSASDRAIYQYLDEMLSDPSEGSGRSASSKNSGQNQNRSPNQGVESSVQSKTATQPKSGKPKPLAIKEPAPRVLSSPESLLGFEKPIVVQQPAKKEADKTAVKSPPKVATQAKTQTKPAVKPTPVVPVSEPPPAVEQPPGPEPPSAPTPEEPEPRIDPDTMVETEKGNERLPPSEPWCDNGRPEWAQHRFECLLFEVAGLKLAVPLVTLGAIHQIDRKFNALPGQFDWFIGILQTNVGNIKVLDTALCVMPERYDASCREGLNYVITLHGFAWGISCHKILKSITLEPEDVKWRSQRGKRPWLAGTVVDQMCALVDTAGFHHVIQQAEDAKPSN